MLRRSFAGRYSAQGGLSDAFGKAVLWAGAASFLPLVAPVASIFAAASALLGVFLAGKYPEKYGGSRQITVGLCLCVAGMGLLFVEGTFFWRWKVDQAYGQRLAITRFRMAEIAQGLERYRQEKGAYPEVTGIFALEAKLEPSYLADLKTLDGFDGAISCECRPDRFVLRAQPPPAPREGSPPPPIFVSGSFQPAPTPPPPPEPPPESVPAVPLPGQPTAEVQAPADGTGG